jgi:putative ABC transport system permease protein
MTADTSEPPADPPPPRAGPPETGLPGRPRVRSLVGDSLAGAVSQPLATATVAFVVLVVCVSVLVTTGQAAVAEQQVVARIDGTGARLLTVVDESGRAEIVAAGLASIEAIDAVEWVVGLGPVTDVRNAAYVTDERAVASRPFYGALPADLAIVAGRSPVQGEAVVGTAAAAALHLADGTGTVATVDGTSTVPVVGVVEGTGPLARLDGTVLVASDPAPGAPVRTAYVMTRDATSVSALGRALPEAVAAVEPAALAVDAPEGTVALQAVITGDLGAGARRTMLLVLGVGLVVVVVTTYGSTTARRRELGRRRALGATRSALVVVVLTQVAVAAAAGALLGVSAGVVVVHRLAGDLPPVDFVAGVAGLAVLVAVLGGLVPAVVAARRDPLKILRVP